MKKQFATFLSAILAGFTIGIGGNVFLALSGTSRPLGALLFAVGLFTICTYGFALFTGRACYIFDNRPGYLVTLVVIWVGNLIGAAAMAAIAGATRLGPAFSEAAAALCDTKLADSWGSLFFLGVLCNLLIYIAVEGYKTCPYELGKYLSILFGVVVFILTGTEHSVADMYYFAMAGKLFAARSLGVLAVISLGNVCGGLILPLLRKAVAALEK